MGVGALKQLDASHAEIKSMHAVQEARRRGVARAVLAHPLALARGAGHVRVSLETGSMDAFAPARALYEGFGFERCAPFSDYTTTQTIRSACA
ncbi:MAG: GNAT family N-acetyltransferase [Dehalococcoidia bacterium]